MTETLCGSTLESEFVLTTAADDDQKCACEGCHEDVDEDLSIQLTCDARGSLADYAEVAFCSFECGMEFTHNAPHEVVSEDILLYTNDPLLAEVSYRGTEEFTLEGETEPIKFDTTFAFLTGHEFEPLMADAADAITDITDSHDLPYEAFDVHVSPL